MSNSTITKIKATADILGGSVFFANENGVDPEYTSTTGLLPNGMYIRLEGSDGSIAYISAYELDKAIGIISEMTMSKASNADLQTVIASLEDKISTVDFELIQSEVNNKASKAELDDMSEVLSAKADQSVVDELIAILNEKASQEFANEIMSQLESKASQEALDDLTTIVISKASASEVADMLNDIKELQDTISTLTNADSIAAINNQIAYLNSEIAKRLTLDDLKSINSNLTNLNTSNENLANKIDELEVEVHKKATSTYVQGQVSELNTAITGLAVKVENKADKADISSKANKTDVDTLVKKVTNINSTVADLEIDVDNNYKELTASVAKKANKTDVENSIATLNTALDAKLNTAVFNELHDALSERVDDLEDDQTTFENNINASVEELECNINNTLNELRSTLNTQSRTITNQGNQISKLETSSSTYADQLKQSWVRVLSSNEYKKLSTPPEGVPYNPRYKYPNTVYLVVDFNKPKAIYIGDILVAKAEAKGSVGFAYTFPIVF